MPTPRSLLGSRCRLAELFVLLFLVTAVSGGRISADSGASSAVAAAEHEAVESEAWGLLRVWQTAGKGPVPPALRAQIDRLWELGRSAPQGSPAALAKGKALHLLVHLADLEGLEERIDSLPAADSTWERVVELMMEVGSLYGEGDLVERVLGPRVAATENPEMRARLWLAMGDAWGEEERLKAEKAYHKALEAAPDSWAARVAQGNLYELANLHLGEPAPAFSVASVTGAPLRSEDLTGRAVVLHVWASW